MKKKLDLDINLVLTFLLKFKTKYHICNFTSIGETKFFMHQIEEYLSEREFDIILIDEIDSCFKILDNDIVCVDENYKLDRLDIKHLANQPSEYIQLLLKVLTDDAIMLEILINYKEKELEKLKGGFDKKKLVQKQFIIPS